jgi:hypothetical protein
MAWRVIWHIRCETCDKLGPASPRSDWAEKQALAKGWLLGNVHDGIHLHLCPECAKLERPDWWPNKEN